MRGLRTWTVFACLTAGIVPEWGNESLATPDEMKAKEQWVQQTLLATDAAVTFYITVKTTDEHMRLFAQVWEAAGEMEMVAYNIPQCTGFALAVETVCEMAKRGWIRYCKESSGDIGYFRELVRRGTNVGLSVLQGDEKTLADGLRAGARGIVSVCASVFPKVYIRAYEAMVGGDSAALAQACEENLLVRTPLVAGGPCSLSGIKYAVSRLAPVDPQQRLMIDRILKDSCVQSR